MKSVDPTVVIVILSLSSAFLCVLSYRTRSRFEVDYEYTDICNLRPFFYSRCLVSTVPLSCLLCYQHTVKKECPSAWPPDCPAIHACAKSIPFECEVKNTLNGLCKLGYLYAESLPQEDKNILLANCLDKKK